MSDLNSKEHNAAITPQALKLKFLLTSFVILSAVEVAKYCDEHVCVCVCVRVCGLSASISPEPYTPYLLIFLCMLPMAVARSSSGRVPKSQGEGTVLGFSSPLTMQCTV